MAAKFFKLHYHISNNGDNTASVHLHRTKEEADKADEEMGDGWGESCSGYETIKLEKGKLFYKEWKSGVWYPLEEMVNYK